MNEHINLMQGDCLQTMKTLADNSVDAIVSDPPYGISFMAKKWDYDVPSVEVWQEAMRVLKPGGHALIACGTRTQHRMVVNIEDAGFEIRDVVSWIYGSGFPKSLNISKAIDKAAGAEREVVGTIKKAHFSGSNFDTNQGWARPSHCNPDGTAKKTMDITAPATDAAKQWDGFGTALKPSSEFFTLCRKPLSEKTIAANVLKWGTGGLNIDGCRVGTDKTGRFPANLIHDGSPEVLELFPETKSGASGKGASTKSGGVFGSGNSVTSEYMPASKGSAARFFYCAKASKKDRDEGLEGFDAIHRANGNKWTDQDYRVSSGERPPSAESGPRKNHHPTVKPTALMQYLCRLITPPGGTVLDPYMGSGSTGKAAIKEGFGFVGCELDPDYFEIAKTRIEHETTE